MEAVIVTWQAGGGAQIAIGLGRLLADRGHRVRIIAPAADRERVSAAGCVHRPLPPEVELSAGRRAEEQRDVLERIFYGHEIADALSAEITRAPCDVVVVDYLLRSAAGLAERLPVADALLIHTIGSFHSETTDGQDSVTGALVRRATCAIVAMPREFDDWENPPANVVHAGPIIEKPAAVDLRPPWSGEGAPLVVASLGSQYMNQEEILRRIADALATMPVRGLILTGEVEPSRVPGSATVEVQAYMPHDALLPAASLVVTHAGTGTLLAAFAAGLPVLCVPLGRDQPQNARRVAELGLGQTIQPDAGTSEISAAIANTLEAPVYRAAAQSMKSVIEGYGGGAPAVSALERFAAARPA